MSTELIQPIQPQVPQAVLPESLDNLPPLRSDMWMQPLPTIRTNKQLAQILGLTSARLLTFSGRNKSEHYAILRIRKRNGSWRVLHNPDQVMRNLQYRILNKLLNQITIPDYVYAFERSKSIPVMAAQHVGKRVVISLDIKDFFHTIKQSKLNQLFIDLGIGVMPSRTLSELCTYKAFVPQGALTSPKVSNIITATTFGPEVYGYCVSKGYTVSIYADDITISSDSPTINTAEVIQDITEMVQRHQFSINRAKTKVMWKRHRQYVCGAVVNSKVNLIKGERLKLRAIVHNISRNGLEAEALKTNTEPAKFLNHIRGRVNWFKQLNPVAGTRLSMKLKTYLLTLKASMQAIRDSAPENMVIDELLVSEVDKTLTDEAALPWMT